MTLPLTATLPMSLLILCVGGAVGSFLNVVVWRVPRGESLLHPPSHCPKCGHAIRPWENIPVLSWLLLRGRCSQCRLPISIKYPLGEAATGVLFLAVWTQTLRRGLPLETAPASLYLAASLLAITQIDIRHRLIPDLITGAGLLVALTLALAMPGSRLAIALPDDPHSGAIIFNGAMDWLAARSPALANPPPIAAAALDCILGAVIGATLLTIVAEAGRRVLGAKTTALPENSTLTVSAHGIRGLDGDRLMPWDDLLPRRLDTVTIVQPATSKALDPHAAPKTPTRLRVTVNANGLSQGGVQAAWPDLGEQTLPAAAVVLPRDVMGYGDVKCLAMIGAFCGADAAIHILLAAALAAVLFSALLAAAAHRRQAMLPFGPFLAAATMAWLLLGNFVFSLFQTIAT
ncbi:MAG: prepilin peptidase [Lentisphaeria bacterium]|nr:prepilin peptidase [Lentisphaeria bacterium]